MKAVEASRQFYHGWQQAELRAVTEAQNTREVYSAEIISLQKTVDDQAAQLRRLQAALADEIQKSRAFAEAYALAEASLRPRTLRKRA